MIRKYTLNENRFETIETEEDAYWFGFLLADGSVYITKQGIYILSLELSNVDADHIEKFKKYLGSNHPIKDVRKNCLRIQISSKTIVSNLIKRGLIPNKTKNMPELDISSNLLNHLYRGYFDGDGWITSRKTVVINNTSNMWEFGFSSGDKQFIESIQKWLAQTSYKGYLIDRNRNNQQVYQLTFGGNNVFESIFSLLYTNSNIFLDRKHQKALIAIEEINRRKQK